MRHDTNERRELERLIEEQRRDARAQAKGRLFMARPDVEDSDCAAPAELVRLVEASGLEERLRHVLVSRLQGRSFGAIAADALLGGLTRQRVQQLEGQGWKRIGLGVSVEEWLTREREERAEALRERGRHVAPWEQHG